MHEDDWFSTNKLVTNGHSLFQAVPRSEARIQNATLLRTLDALAAGRHIVLAMDIEFYAVLMQDATYGRERFSMSSSPRVSCGPKGACTSVAMFPREIGGHLLIKSSAHTTTTTSTTGRHEERVYKQWTRAGRFHFKIPLELYMPSGTSPGPFVDVAFVPWDVASTDERAQSLLRRTEERLVQELVHTDVASRFCIFDDALSERGKALKRDALRAYDADASIPCVPAADLPDIVTDLVAIMDCSKLVVKEHVDIDAMHNLCGFLGIARPSRLSLFDVAISNGICRATMGSAKLADVYKHMCTNTSGPSSSSGQSGPTCAWLDELAPPWHMRSHDPAADAFMTLCVGLVLMQSLSWAMFRRCFHAPKP